MASFFALLLRICPESYRAYAERLRVSTLGERMARGVYWSLIGALLGRGLTVISSVASARLLGLQDFGGLGIIQSTVGMAQIAAGFGLGITATKHIAEYKRSDPAKIGRILGLCEVTAGVVGLAVGLAVAYCSPWLASRTLANPALASPLAISSILIALGALTGAQGGALAGFEAFRAIAIVNTAGSVVSLPLIILGGYWGGLPGVIWGLVGGMVFQFVFNQIALRRISQEAGVVISLSGSLEEWPVLWKFSLPAFLSNFAVSVFNWGCAAMLVNSMGGYSEMGIYNAANQIFIALMFLPTLIGQVALPILSERYGRADSDHVKKLLALSISANLLILMPLIVVGVAGSPQIMRVFGEGYQGAGLTLVVVLLSAALLAVQIPVGNIVVASGRMWTGTMMNLAWGISFLLFASLWVSRGSFGLAVARLAAYGIHALWTFYFAYCEIRNLSAQKVRARADSGLQTNPVGIL